MRQNAPKSNHWRKPVGRGALRLFRYRLRQQSEPHLASHVIEPPTAHAVGIPAIAFVSHWLTPVVGQIDRHYATFAFVVASGSGFEPQGSGGCRCHSPGLHLFWSRFGCKKPDWDPRQIQFWSFEYKSIVGKALNVIHGASPIRKPLIPKDTITLCESCRDHLLADALHSLSRFPWTKKLRARVS